MLFDRKSKSSVKTQHTDDFVIEMTESAKKKTNLSNVAKVNQKLTATNLRNLIYTAEGASGITGGADFSASKASRCRYNYFKKKNVKI